MSAASDWNDRMEAQKIVKQYSESPGVLNQLWKVLRERELEKARLEGLI